MEGSTSPAPNDHERWARLSDKQRACLDLLLERQTSKQIARRLNISKPTVDQRITAARNILGAADRDEAAIFYARLKRLYDRITYDPVHLPPPPTLVPSDFSDGGPFNVLELRDRSRSMNVPSGDSLPFGKIWRHDHGLTERLVIMAAMLVAAVIILLGGLGIAQALTRLISG